MHGDLSAAHQRRIREIAHTEHVAAMPAVRKASVGTPAASNLTRLGKKTAQQGAKLGAPDSPAGSVHAADGGPELFGSARLTIDEDADGGITGDSGGHARRGSHPHPQRRTHPGRALFWHPRPTQGHA